MNDATPSSTASGRPTAMPLPTHAATARARWRTLPREGRDTLFLLAVIAWTILPHVPYLPAWCSAFAVVVLLWRARLAWRQGALPGRWVMAAALAGALALTLVSHRTLLGKEAGVTLVVALMALKTLELRARRDAFVVFFLGFFLVLTQFFHGQSIALALAMLVSVWGLLTALVLAHMPAGVPALAQAAALAGRCALIGTPAMVALFVLFPRVGPLWGVPSDASAAKTGLSSSMRMGSMADLAIDDSVAMRLRFTGALPPPEALYFRGPVLTFFDGREWLPAPARLAPGSRTAATVEPAASDPAVAYQATVEPLPIAVLPLLEMATTPPRIEGYALRRGADLTWRLDRLLRERVRFDAVARIAARHGPLERHPALADALALPADANPRMLAWARALRAQVGDASGGEPDAAALAAALLRHVRQGGYLYTLAPGTYGDDGGLNAIDEFWLDRKQGFCEHYAAAFVVAMRAAGVPARVVTGYQGTDPLLVDGYAIVRQSNAHAWAEYWQAGRGWVRADPTAAVAPDRIVRSRRLAPPPGLVESALGGVSPALLQQLKGAWEVLDNRWNQWVLNYSRGQQFELLKNLGIESPSWEDLARLLAGGVGVVGLVGALWAWRDRRRLDPWARQALVLRRALQGVGIDAAPHDTPRALAARVRARFGAAGDALAALLGTVEGARYGRRAQSQPDRRLAAAVRREAARLRRLKLSVPPENAPASGLS